MVLVRSLFWGSAVSLIVGLGVYVMSFGDAAAAFGHQSQVEAIAGAIFFFIFVTPLVYVGARREQNYLLCLNCHKVFHSKVKGCDACQGTTVEIQKFYRARARERRQSKA